MFPGLFTMCLKVSDLASTRRFYQALGFAVHIDQPELVLLNNGDVDIALMTFLEASCLNFRGTDPLQLHRHMAAANLDLDGEPEKHDKAGTGSWTTRDPDGNPVFIDTNRDEVGANGLALALQRVLDATSKQLINIGAPERCRDAFQSKVAERFMPPERRAQTSLGLDTTALPEPGSYAGDFCLCLKTANNPGSRNFYQALGFEVAGNDDEQWVAMDNGDCRISLMTFLGANWLNFRGADPFEIHARVRAAGLTPEGEPSRYSGEEFGSAPGAHWQTNDPQGNVVYFDTTDPERIVPGDPAAVGSVLHRARRQLLNVNADAAIIRAFDAEILESFT